MSVSLKIAESCDFEDYYKIRCGLSDIYWLGYDGIPSRELMYQVFMGRTSSNRFEQQGDKRIYMIQTNGRNVGMIQFSLSVDGLEFGYSVLDEERGKGYGSAGIMLAVVIARQYSDHCFAHIRDDNIASQKAMMRAGLKPTEIFELRPFPHSGVVKYRKYILDKNNTC